MLASPFAIMRPLIFNISITSELPTGVSRTYMPVPPPVTSATRPVKSVAAEKSRLEFKLELEDIFANGRWALRLDRRPFYTIKIELLSEKRSRRQLRDRKVIHTL